MCTKRENYNEGTENLLKVSNKVCVGKNFACGTFMPEQQNSGQNNTITVYKTFFLKTTNILDRHCCVKN